ncbi:MAG: hypothetical protein ACSLE8_25175, partial [Rhodococcus sp. (in: high G+C Gram-positive bacteria)]
ARGPPPIEVVNRVHRRRDGDHRPPPTIEASATTLQSRTNTDQNAGLEKMSVVRCTIGMGVEL